MLAIVAMAKRRGATASIEHYALRAAPLVIGSLAAFWFFERLAGFLT